MFAPADPDPHFLLQVIPSFLLAYTLPSLFSGVQVNRPLQHAEMSELRCHDHIR